jgi:signal transduction histidine kinase
MRFIVSTRILEHLGSDLITSNLIAFSELIKNSYDARADEVSLRFLSDINNIDMSNFTNPVEKGMVDAISQYALKSHVLIIEDDGFGMGINDIQNGFLTIGTDIKKKTKLNLSQDSRLPLGEKGIGRLSAQRLSKVLFLETTSIEDEYATVVLINWDNIIEKKYFEEIELPFFTIPKKKSSYTRLWFVDLNFEFSEFIDFEKEQQLDLFDEFMPKIALREDFETSLSFLMSPFEEGETDEELKLADKKGINPIKLDGFIINVWMDNHKISFNTKSEILKLAEGIYKFSLTKNEEGDLNLKINLTWEPWFLERIHNRLVGRELFKDYQRDHSFYSNLLEKYMDRFNKTLDILLTQEELVRGFNRYDLRALSQICPVEGKVNLFKRDNLLASMAIESSKKINKINGNFTVKQIREFLDNRNGIKLFRGKMRVATVGDKDSDWLRFQQYSTKGQQFFRMDLGNVIGYVKINDPMQEYIREISSRLDLSVNKHSIALKSFLNSMFHDYFYELSRSSSHIAKDIFEQENLLPRNPVKDLHEEVDRTIKAVEESRSNLSEFEHMMGSLKNSLNKNNAEGNVSIQKAIEALSITSTAFKSNIDNTLKLVSNSKNLLKRVDHEKKLVELESYNNYKLMANGLITEVITHEMHSILSNLGSEYDYELHFKNIENFVLKLHKNIDLYSQSVQPIHKRFKFVNTRMNEMSDLYSFLEKTFIYKGTSEDLVSEDLKAFIENLEKRFSKRLEDNNVTLVYSTINTSLRVPKGALIHIFYNLIDNSLYWIKERRIQAKTDKHYDTKIPDFIKIEQINQNTILYSDSGTGVIERMDNTLFHPLASGKERNGRGLGLYIIRKLLHSFGADIELLHDRNLYNRRFLFSLNFNTEHIEDNLEKE